MTRWTQEQVDEYVEKYKANRGQGPNFPILDGIDLGPESELQRKAEAWLNGKGYPYIHDRSRGKNKPGSILDLHIYLPKGRHVVIECKDKKGRMTDEQKETYRKLLYLGHEVYECRSFKRFLQIMENENAPNL
jgi:hypothetical protein